MNVADLKWRPESYSDFPDPVALVLNGIQGQMRREMVHDMLTAEGKHREFYDDVLGSIEPGILKEQADEQVIQNLSNFHSPVWMGGEYLPGVVPGEVEIARIVLHSTHGDIISVRARWKLGCYHYRVVDEYEELGTKYALSRETSIRTLTLGELIDLLQTSKAVNSCVGIEGDGLVESWWDAHYGEGVPPEDCLYAFVESDLYSELSAWYEKRANEWISERREEERLQRCEDCGKMCNSTADHDCSEKGARLAREEERRRANN